MSGVGRGRGAVMPAWMKAKALDQNPAPGSGKNKVLKLKSLVFENLY